MATTNVGNPLKTALRNHMKTEVLKSITPESQKRQSELITEKVLQTEAFRQAQHISIYLSTPPEVDTTALLREMFRLDKKVFVPTYRGNDMEMVRLKSMEDYDSLPVTKWNIKQPNIKEGRENALANGIGIDLFLMPGIAFTRNGSRCGHGKGYYDGFLTRHKNTYPHKKVTTMALAYNEQVLEDGEVPMEAHDVRLTCVMTA